VTIPEGCAGRSQLTVVDGQNRALSAAWLEIDAPAPVAPPTVRDHRGKKGRKGPKVRDHRRRGKKRRGY